MTARSFLLRGLLAGFVAGLFAFLVAHQVGEPHVNAAIAVEESHAATESHDHAGAGHTHEEDGTVISRHDQSTWGLATGTLATGTALGGIVALVAAGAMGRIGRLRPSQTTALVSVIGFVAVSLVPFVKYPATPPAVGNADTIGHRTTVFFVYLLVSVLAAAGATVLAARLLRTRSTFQAVLVAAVAYLVVVVVVGQLMPTVNEIGDFPADTLWYFRRASLLTLTTMWAVIGIVLTGLVGRLADPQTAPAARRDVTVPA